MSGCDNSDVKLEYIYIFSFILLRGEESRVF
jgi:hypothetical protein